MKQSVLTIQALKQTERLGNSLRTDKEILPEHYEVVSQPFYRGDGEHSIKELQELCSQFKEYCHQQAIIKQELMHFINEN